MLDIKSQRLIGRGTFGDVYVATLHDGSVIAIKKCKRGKDEVSMENEIESHKSIDSHKNIVQYICSFKSEKHIMIGIEYIDGCDLLIYFNKYIKTNTSKRLTDDIAKKIFNQLLDGLKFIHKCNICHRDLKLENILIDKDLNIKICDFGNATSTEKLLDDISGTSEYCAPEVLLGSYDGCLADIWSVGIILYVLLSGRYPFNIPNIYTPYRTFNIPYLDHITHIEFSLIREIIIENPKYRLSILEIRKHYWLC